ncbi:hypothetical protein Dshi_3230 [Dinoroseobacter shibae DFL 12 = DSM 16493]|uniref:Uncharacterized protein n=1 Tax=Dinoroseobacter shibae (strain DSM 16493 / NCIMB 14021 / DFL 12) TaxID=398580 RepID=A8LMN8_DINSH|nr:hypothetical protein Dshi_3230 [Dinoroseobacter shibae DFL 12 = DSM 16493]
MKQHQGYPPRRSAILPPSLTGTTRPSPSFVRKYSGGVTAGDGGSAPAGHASLPSPPTALTFVNAAAQTPRNPPTNFSGESG